MNTSHVLTAIFGGVIGCGIGYFVTKHKYESILQQRLDEYTNALDDELNSKDKVIVKMAENLYTPNDDIPEDLIIDDFIQTEDTKKQKELIKFVSEQEVVDSDSEVLEFEYYMESRELVDSNGAIMEVGEVEFYIGLDLIEYIRCGDEDNYHLYNSVLDKYIEVIRDEGTYQ